MNFYGWIPALIASYDPDASVNHVDGRGDAGFCCCLRVYSTPRKTGANQALQWHLFGLEMS